MATDSKVAFNTVTFTIASGQSLSTERQSMGMSVPIGILMPAAWTSAAPLTFQASIDGDNYFNLYDSSGNEVSVTADASRFIAVEGASFAGARYLKVRSGTAGAAVAQAADRIVTVVGRRERVI